MTKRLLSLLLAVALLCAVCCCAWADGKDKYQAFVDKYGPDYEDEIDWAQFIEDMGGPEAIDWKKLVHTIGYEGEKKLEYRWEELYDFLDYEPFMEMYALVMEADEELAQEHFANAPELIKTFCSTAHMESYPLDMLNDFLELAVHRLVPQAVQKIEPGIPAFRNAPPGSFSSQIALGLGTSTLAPHYAELGSHGHDENTIGQQLYIFFITWVEQTEDGGYRLKNDDETVMIINTTIVHEMFHAFMVDYNRRGMDMMQTNDDSMDSLLAKKDHVILPNWFKEGAAVLNAGGYHYYENHWTWLGLFDPEGNTPSCTPAGIRRTYSQLVSDLNLDRDGDDYYCGCYFGPVAVAWLSDMQWQADGHPSAITHSADGSVTAVNEEGLMNGFSRILERLHNGEPLDDIIRRVTGARFLDAEDLSRRFIQDGAGGSDEGTAEFCADWLNYLEALSREKGYMVSGSLLAGLASSEMDLLDWNKQASSSLYVPTDKFSVASTVMNKDAAGTAGRSAFSVETWREGAKYVCAEGADGVYVKGSGAPLPFVFERTVNSDAAFRKVWEGGSENSIDFTLYKADGSAYHHGFDKKAVSPAEWRYSAWFSKAVACYVIEEPVEGYQTRYENVGVYAHITDRCCDGGTIVNYRVPKTGDEAPVWLWLGCVAAGLMVMTLALRSGKRKKAHAR